MQNCVFFIFIQNAHYGLTLNREILLPFIPSKEIDFELLDDEFAKPTSIVYSVIGERWEVVFECGNEFDDGRNLGSVDPRKIAKKFLVAGWSPCSEKIGEEIASYA